VNANEVSHFGDGEQRACRGRATSDGTPPPSWEHFPRACDRRARTRASTGVIRVLHIEIHVFAFPPEAARVVRLYKGRTGDSRLMVVEPPWA